MSTKQDTLVSIGCFAYNHERYIRDALDGFLMQQTDFRYEILIHDDASTDGTADIIRMYEAKYPDVIKPIYQRENQYSRGVGILPLNLWRAQGKYIALCEGDDYWTDPMKLQRQADYMREHPGCSLSAHAAVVVSGDRKKLGWMRPRRRDAEFSAADVIQGGGDMIATDSMFFPFEKWLVCPEFFTSWPVGDYPLAIYLATTGDVHYMADVMSAYRTGIPCQWTAQLRNSAEKYRSHMLQIEAKLRELDAFTGGRYAGAICRRIQMNRIYMGDVSVMDDPGCREAYRALPVMHRMKAGLHHRFPGLCALVNKLKGRSNGISG